MQTLLKDKAVASVAWNPFRIFDLDPCVIEPGTPISSVAKKLGVNWKSQPFIAQLNGKYVLQKYWHSLHLKVGDVLAFMALPQGGDSSEEGGGKNTLAIALQIALTIAAVAIAGPAAGAITGKTTGLLFEVTKAAVFAVVVAGGSALINTMVTPASPAFGNFSSVTSNPSIAGGGGNSQAVASPSYDISAQGNIARLGQAIPVLYGRHKVFPDFASQPYNEFENDNQFLYQLFVITQGYLEIESIRIGETFIENFPEITTEIVEPGGTVTLFETNVYQAVEASGQDMEKDIDIGPFPAFPAGKTGTSVDVDVAWPGGGDGSNTIWIVERRTIDDQNNPTGSFVQIGSESFNAPTNKVSRRTYKYTGLPDVRHEIRVRRTDSGNPRIQWVGLRGRMPNINQFGDVTLLAMKMRATNSLSTTTARKINVIGTRKLPFYQGPTVTVLDEYWTGYENQVEAQNAGWTFGQSGGGWIFNAAQDRSDCDGAQTAIVNLTKGITVTEDITYDLIVTTTNVTAGSLSIKFTGGTDAVPIDFTPISSNGTFSYRIVANAGNDTFTLEADANFAGSVGPVTVQTAKWSELKPTKSIAWAGVDALRNSTYGANHSDDKIDLASLYALDNVWMSRGDQLNGIFDQSITVWDALLKIFKAGRAKPYHQAGLIRFHRDAPQIVPVTMFNISNTVRDSFSLEAVLPKINEVADGVTAEFFDEDVWKPNTVTVGVNGATPNNPARELLFGVTNISQATREAGYMAAANRFRRLFPSFSTELEGLIPGQGSFIIVSSDIPRWGQSGFLRTWDENTLIARLSNTPELEEGSDYVIRVRAQDGEPSQLVSITQPDILRADEVLLASVPVRQNGLPLGINTSGDRVQTLYDLGTTGDDPVECLVSSIVPRGDQVEIICVVEDPRVHVN